MSPTVATLAFVVAVAAATYSTWSPCGQSMLSQLNPLAERSRGQRYGVTATWFVIGAFAGGVTLGLGMMALALAVDALAPTATVATAIAAVAALAGAASDGHLLPWSPPFLRRQVNEDWLPHYRGWLYGLGFGWQIGTGVTTYIMTAAVFVTIALGALTGAPWVALAVALTFALVRGLVVLATARLDSFEALAAFHRRFHSLAPVVRRGVIAVQLGAALVAGFAAWGWAGAVGVAVAVVGGVLLSRARHPGADRPARARTRPAPAASTPR